ncbi:hypothetical protein BDF19DRAFT_399952 [Syncephalis fuscata]|nr:hypothetical protein BDF19DRAFT_399952 [Syncephalis fuscata]
MLVSRLFGASPFDDLVDRATSEYLPAGQEDLILSLDVCDYIRGKQVEPRTAIRALKRRISHRNPNVQMLGLKLTDTCVKNGGHHFLVEVASRDFMDYLTELLNQPSTTTEVRNKILALIQNWSHTFQSRSDLTYVCDVHRALVSSGHIFPKLEKTNASMIDTMTPPDWTDSDVCERCRTQFTFTNRKHHCRNCGKTFCQPCSSYELALPHIGIHQEVRTCHGCYHSIKGIRSTSGNTSNTGHLLLGSQSASGPSGTTGEGHDSDDEDMKRAIELSLKESQAHRPVAPPPRQQQQQQQQQQQDPDLAAAIAASLQETHISQSNDTRIRTSSRPPSRSTSTPQNIVLFSTLVERLQATNGSVMGDSQVQALNHQIGSLRPKLIKGLEESARKHRAYLELHEKLTASQKQYDTMLKEQQMAAYHAQQQQQQQLRLQQQQQQHLIQNGWAVPQPMPNPPYANIIYTQALPINDTPYPPTYANTNANYPNGQPPQSMHIPQQPHPQPQLSPAVSASYVATPMPSQPPIGYPQSTASTSIVHTNPIYSMASNQPTYTTANTVTDHQMNGLNTPTPTTNNNSGGGYTSNPVYVNHQATLSTTPTHQTTATATTATTTTTTTAVPNAPPQPPINTVNTTTPTSGYTTNEHSSNSHPTGQSTASFTDPTSTGGYTTANSLPTLQSTYTMPSATTNTTTTPVPQSIHSTNNHNQPPQQYTTMESNKDASPHSNTRTQHQHTPSNPFHQQGWKVNNGGTIDQVLANAPTAPNLPPLPSVPQPAPIGTPNTYNYPPPPPQEQQQQHTISPSLIEL